MRFNYSPSYGNQEPFSTPHTVTMLLVLLLFIIYAAFWTKIEGGEQNNIRKCVQKLAVLRTRGPRFHAHRLTLLKRARRTCCWQLLFTHLPLRARCSSCLCVCAAAYLRPWPWA